MTNYPPLIFVAGMPRSGSMWTYNVCRRLIRAAGKSPWPEQVPPDESVAIERALSTPPAPHQVYCIKTHFRIPTDQPQTRIICNYRDIRDAMLSYMRFMKCPYEKGLAVAKSSMSLTDYFLGANSPYVLGVNYADLVSQPLSVIEKVANFISLKVGLSDRQAINAALSRQAVARQLQEMAVVELNDEGKVKQTAEALQYSGTLNYDGSFRVYDHATGFQSDHISSYEDGQWREILTPMQNAQLNEVASDWLVRYGFE